MTLHRQSLPTALNDVVFETLKSLHWRARFEGHHVYWFVDRGGCVRVLVTIVTDWHIETYQTHAGEQVVRIPVSRRSEDFSFSPQQVASFGVDGLQRYIERAFNLTFDGDATPLDEFQSTRRRVA
jgi:hypothetical protein